MIDVKCDVCGWPMTMPGAIVNSPPINFNPMITKKFHVCTFCWCTKVKKLFEKGETSG